MNAFARYDWPGLAGVLLAGLFAGCTAVPAVSEADSSPGEYFLPSEVDEKPMVVSQVAPLYPPPSQRSQSSAEVVVAFIVDEQGQVTAAKVMPSEDGTPGDPAFEAAALTAVQQWRFRPGIKHGVPVKVSWRVPIEFRSADK